MPDTVMDLILIAMSFLIVVASYIIYALHRKALTNALKDLRQPGEWRKEWAAKEKARKRAAKAE